MLRSTCPLTSGKTATEGAARAVFLDRDGVLIEDTGYPSDPDAVTLLPRAGEALRALRAAGWRLVVVSNQSGVARGYFGLDAVERMHDRLRSLLAAEGVTLDAVYFCPHHPEGSVTEYRGACDHRKPGAGMLRSAAATIRLDLRECWLVGDKESDVQAAHDAGCRAIRIGLQTTAAEAAARDLGEAARIILEECPMPNVQCPLAREERGSQ